MNVPSKWSELPSLQAQGVEEAETEHEFLVSGTVLAAFEGVLIKSKVRSHDVVSKSLWWLVCALYTILKDRHWELVSWHRSQPNSEVAGSVFLDLLNQSIESRHERWCQVTVLQHNPKLIFLCLLNSFHGLASLTLTKGKLKELDFLSVRQLLELSHWISSSRKDHNNWSLVSRVIKYLIKVEWWWSNEVLSEFLIFLNELLNSLDDLVWSQDSDDN